MVAAADTFEEKKTPKYIDPLPTHHKQKTGFCALSICVNDICRMIFVVFLSVTALSTLTDVRGLVSFLHRIVLQFLFVEHEEQLAQPHTVCVTRGSLFFLLLGLRLEVGQLISNGSMLINFLYVAPCVIKMMNASRGTILQCVDFLWKINKRHNQSNLFHSRSRWYESLK